MAFDGITVAAIVRELSTVLTGGRIYKITQPEADELILTIRKVEDSVKQRRLVLSADASLPLVYLTEENKKAPMTAPSFCMLLRKHLQGGRIRSVTQPSLERIIRIEIEHLDELGDLKCGTLLIELMGKYSNIIFVDENSTIIDSIKRIPASVSSVREVLPGRQYFIPMTQDKKNPLGTDHGEFYSLVRSKAMPIFKALYNTYTGLSPIISQEICYRADVDADRPAMALTDEEAEKLFASFSAIMETVQGGSFQPELIYLNEKPKDYAALPLTLYHESPDVLVKAFADMSDLIRQFYQEKDAVTRIRQKSSDLRRIVQSALERSIRKYDLQQNQMKDTGKKDKFRLYGELLTVYGYSTKPDGKTLIVTDYNTGKEVKIPIDPALSVGQNAKKYYDKYDRLKRTQAALTEQMAQSRADVDHLESIATSLDIARQEEDLTEIREELIASGYIHHKGGSGKGRKKLKSRPLHFVSSDGFDIYVGKNNYQNDNLTFHVADGEDWWFHAKKIPGSHVILKTAGKEVPDRAFEEAASLAAYYSKGRNQEKVEVDYLKKRDVKKPGGSKPGFVVYYTNYSMVIGTDISALTLLEDGSSL